MNNLYQSLNQNQSQNNIMSQVQSVLSEVKQSGMTPEQLFYKKAQEQGVDVQGVLSQAKQLASQFNFR